MLLNTLLSTNAVGKAGPELLQLLWRALQMQLLTQYHLTLKLLPKCMHGLDEEIQLYSDTPSLFRYQLSQVTGFSEYVVT